MAISWQISCIELLRVLIGDLDEVQIYTDAKLKRILIVAAYQVATDATFSTPFTVDLPEQSISPDPIDTDEQFVNLMCLKAACIIDTGKAIKAAGKAVSGNDMKAVRFDLTGVAENTIKLLKEGYCKAYKEAIIDYSYGPGILGRSVMSPFRTYARGIYPMNPYFWETV